MTNLNHIRVLCWDLGNYTTLVQTWLRVSSVLCKLGLGQLGPVHELAWFTRCSQLSPVTLTQTLLSVNVWRQYMWYSLIVVSFRPCMLHYAFEEMIYFEYSLFL